MYDYQIERKKIFTESGQVMFLAIRDKAFELCRLAGCVTMEKIIMGARGGDSWQMLACVDRLKEIGELIEIDRTISPAVQYRIFILPNYGY